MDLKKLAAEKAVSFVRNDMVLGLGTGSTAYWAIEGIGRMVREQGLRVKAIATSMRSEQQAIGLGIPMVSFSEIDQIDLTIDGADEADSNLQLIKGGGGALLREKIVATNSRELLIVADESKLVGKLGKFPLPVEVTVFGWEKTFQKLKALGCKPALRLSADKQEPYKTDNGNYIVDCSFQQIDEAAVLHQQINSIVGVVENGLFISLASKLIIGCKDGHIQLISRT